MLDAETGEAVEDVILERWRPVHQVWQDCSQRHGDQPGLVTLESAKAESWRIRLFAPGYRAVERTIQPARRNGAWAHERIELKPGTSIALTVTDGDGQPVPEVQVWMGRHQLATTDDAGRARVDTPLRGRQLFLRKPGFTVRYFGLEALELTVELERER